MTTTILDVAAATVDPAPGGWFQTQSRDGENIPLQVDLTGTGTVTLQGRLGPGYPPVDLVAKTADFGGLVARFPQMRAVLSGVDATNGTSARVGIYANTVAI